MSSKAVSNVAPASVRRASLAQGGLCPLSRGQIALAFDGARVRGRDAPATAAGACPERSRRDSGATANRRASDGILRFNEYRFTGYLPLICSSRLSNQQFDSLGLGRR